MRHIATALTFLSFFVFGTPGIAHDPELTGYTSYSHDLRYRDDNIVVAELPRKVSGVMLAEIIAEEAKTIKEISIESLPRYSFVPGSVKKEIEQYRFKISYSPHSQFLKWWTWGPPETFVLAFAPDKEYTHLVFESFSGITTSHPRFKNIEKDFEQLVSRIYKKLTPHREHSKDE